MDMDKLRSQFIKASPTLEETQRRSGIDELKSQLQTDSSEQQQAKSPTLESTEVIFITSSGADIMEIQEIAETTGRKIRAMNKMFEEMSFDCDSCEFVDVCDEVEELREMKKSIDKLNKENMER